MEQVIDQEIPVREEGRSRLLKYRAHLIALALAVTAGVCGLRWWLWETGHVRTDNAFVQSANLPVSPRVPGMVRRVLVRDNQYVRQGDLLVELEGDDYLIQVNKADAALGVAENESSGDYLKTGVAEAAVEIARVRLAQAERDLQRAEELFGMEIVARMEVENLTAARQTARHQLKEAQEAWRKARAEAGLQARTGAGAKVMERKAYLEEARRQLAFTRIVAPCDGYVTRKSVEPGANVAAGQTLLTLVSLDEAWITANFKEGELERIRPGQKVVFTADAYRGRSFTGRVESIMAGAGAAFSVLPPENATGNFVKVVQRIPVKIAIDRGSDPEHLLRVGMSVVPTVELAPTRERVAARPYRGVAVPLP